MLPADQDVAGPRVLADSLLDAFGIITVALGVDSEAEVFGQWFNSEVRTLSGAIYRIVIVRCLWLVTKGERERESN